MASPFPKTPAESSTRRIRSGIELKSFRNDQGIMSVPSSSPWGTRLRPRRADLETCTACPATMWPTRSSRVRCPTSTTHLTWVSSPFSPRSSGRSAAAVFAAQELTRFREQATSLARRSRPTSLPATRASETTAPSTFVHLSPGSGRAMTLTSARTDLRHGRVRHDDRGDGCQGGRQPAGAVRQVCAPYCRVVDCPRS